MVGAVPCALRAFGPLATVSTPTRAPLLARRAATGILPATVSVLGAAAAISTAPVSVSGPIVSPPTLAFAPGVPSALALLVPGAPVVATGGATTTTGTVFVSPISVVRTARPDGVEPVIRPAHVSASPQSDDGAMGHRAVW